jgi:hypothetical protein
MKKFTFFIFALLFFLIVHCTLLIEHCMCQWLNQPLPVSGDVFDIKFFDANTGIISMDNPVVLRTTNGGDNWQIISSNRILGMQKIDNNIIYGYGRPTLADDRIYRSFNKGLTWDSVAITGYTYQGISFINKDTGWISGFDGNFYRVFKTTNGGVTLQTLPVTFGKGIIFFLNYKINGEYYGWCSDDIFMHRTTNSGNNWFQVTNTGFTLVQLQFINENIGYATFGGNRFLKTSNGGLNWTAQIMPTGNGIVGHNVTLFYNVKNDTLYGDSGSRYLNGRNRGIIWKTTNGGMNWGFQQPDTSYIWGMYNGIGFGDSISGWSSNIHTTNGGGPMFVSDVSNNTTTVPIKIELKQNYPNPFNPGTTFEFSLPDEYFVSLRIYDISGRVVSWAFIGFLLEKGNHKFTMYDFSSLGLASGVYFYRLEATDKKTREYVFSDTKKMVYIK